MRFRREESPARKAESRSSLTTSGKARPIPVARSSRTPAPARAPLCGAMRGIRSLRKLQVWRGV